MKKCGILRLSVPDFDLILDIYKNNDNDINFILHPLMGSQDYKYNFHKTVFNYNSLKHLLNEVGLTNVKRWVPGSSDLTTFDDWSNRAIFYNGKDYPISLNIEAVK